MVTQPVFDAKNELIIPQNSILHGTVLQAAASAPFRDITARCVSRSIR